MYFDDEPYVVNCGFHRTFHKTFCHNFLGFIIPITGSSCTSEMLSVQLKIHAFLTSALRDMQLALAPATLPPDKKGPNTQCI
jgi:hypothetical protein